MHPDKSAEPRAGEAFQQLQRAYETLRDEAGQQKALSQPSARAESGLDAAARPRWTGVPPFSEMERELTRMQAGALCARVRERLHACSLVYSARVCRRRIIQLGRSRRSDGRRARKSGAPCEESVRRVA